MPWPGTDATDASESPVVGAPADPIKAAAWRAANKGRVHSAEFCAHLSAIKTRHGHAPGKGRRSPTYLTWVAMRNRCTNPKQDNYKYYGGIGVTICERWAVFANFLADMGERRPGLTLDRIDGNKGYEPGNCRWADRHAQRVNRRPGTVGAPRVEAA